MDSVAYLDGIKDKETLLVENSGISHLKDNLAGCITNAEETLKKAQKAEQSQILDMLQEMKGQCRQWKKTAPRKTKRKMKLTVY